MSNRSQEKMSQIYHLKCGLLACYTDNIEENQQSYITVIVNEFLSHWRACSAFIASAKNHSYAAGWLLDINLILQLFANAKLLCVCSSAEWLTQGLVGQTWWVPMQAEWKWAKLFVAMMDPLSQQNTERIKISTCILSSFPSVFADQMTFTTT